MCGALAALGGGREVTSQAETPDFDRLARQQSETDRAWRIASQGRMLMDKISYRSRAGGLEIPAFVFRPLGREAAGSRPALVWVHEDVRGHLYEHYIPYVLDATSKGYIVIAPEYRGSVGYGRAFFDAIDYGGAEVEDVVTAADVLQMRYPGVDATRIAIMGWSHGGLIAMLAVFRHPTTFHAAVAIVPVANLLQRLSVERRGAAAPAHRSAEPVRRPAE